MAELTGSGALIFDGEFPRDVTEKYIVKETLGQGTFGVVRRCIDKLKGESFALKTILKSKVPDPEVLKREITIMQQVDHPHIIRLYDVYENEKNIFLVTELCTGGELYDRVVDKTLSNEHFSEYDAARIIRNILSAIGYIHSKGIVHRDLKPEVRMIRSISYTSLLLLFVALTYPRFFSYRTFC
jgi:serine/threonine protein kinase